MEEPPARRRCPKGHAACDGACVNFTEVPSSGRSGIWKVFTLKRVGSSLDNSEACCLLCHKRRAYGRSGDALKKHVVKDHMDALLDYWPQQHELKQKTLSTLMARSNDAARDRSAQAQAATQHLILWAADVGASLNSFQHPEFCRNPRSAV